MSALLPNNQIDLLQSGAEYFPAVLAAIAAAQNEVRLETYIFANDECGREVAAALAAAAQRGVRVHVVVDGFGSPLFMADFGRALVAAGAEVFIFRPEVARFRLRRNRLRRLHRKLVCVDACSAFVGGINIINDCAADTTDAPRLDYAVHVSGALLVPIHAAMVHMWSMLRWVSLGRRYAPALPQVVCIESHGTALARFVVRDNIRHRRDIENAYLAAIENATQEIIIANAYFLPGLRFRRALTAAAQRGVQVTLLVQGRVEYRLQHYASQSFYSHLRVAGIVIQSYTKSFLHAKVAVIDGHWATVGSSNIDPFSLLLAREANVVIEDRAFAATLRQSLCKAIDEGASALPAQKQSLLSRLRGWLAYGAARIMLGLSGYGRGF